MQYCVEVYGGEELLQRLLKAIPEIKSQSTHPKPLKLYTRRGQEVKHQAVDYTGDDKMTTGAMSTLLGIKGLHKVLVVDFASGNVYRGGVLLDLQIRPPKNI